MDVKTIDSTWFFQQLDNKGASLRELARFMSLDPSAVSRMLNGERKMSADEQDQISNFLAVDLREVAARRRGAETGLSENNQATYDSESGSPKPAVRMFTEDDIIYKGDKRWMAKEDGTLIELHPAYGAMKATMTVPADLDLTAPADPDWGKVYGDD